MDPATNRPAINALNALFERLQYSFPRYLSEAPPWTGARGEALAMQTLSDLVADQQAHLARLAELVRQLGGQVNSSSYPMEFTDLHFLSLEFLWGELIRYQREDIRAIEGVVARLEEPREARQLGLEILGGELAHLDQLEAVHPGAGATTGAHPA